MGRHLVLVGGGHAHLPVILRIPRWIRRGHRVTLVTPEPYHYYSGMGPGVLAGRYEPREARFHVRKMALDRGAEFVPGEVVRIDPERRRLWLESGHRIGYDVVSFNVGTRVPLESLGERTENLIPVKPLQCLVESRRRLLALPAGSVPKLLVIGGGPSGVEVSGALDALFRLRGEEVSITLLGGSRLLDALGNRARRLAKASLERRGVRVLERVRCQSLGRRAVRLSDGRLWDFDLAFAAIGIQPGTLFRGSGLPLGSSGGLLVDRHLRSIGRPEILGAGDCIELEGFALARVGVHAVRQSPILAYNLEASLEGRPLKRFEPRQEYLLLLGLGDGTALAWRSGRVWRHRVLMNLKEYIDRRFVRRYQVSGEAQVNEGS